MHIQNILNNAYYFMVLVGKNATGIFQFEKRPTTIKTNIWVASSGIVELPSDDNDPSSSSIWFWVAPRSTNPINLPVSSKTRSFLLETLSCIRPNQESESLGSDLSRISFLTKSINDGSNPKPDL